MSIFDAKHYIKTATLIRERPLHIWPWEIGYFAPMGKINDLSSAVGAEIYR